MEFQTGDDVTPKKPPAPGTLRLFGTVTGWATCLFQEVRLVMVRWSGADWDAAYAPGELAHVD